jgi:hypothetical protein
MLEISDVDAVEWRLFLCALVFFVAATCGMGHRAATLWGLHQA